MQGFTEFLPISSSGHLALVEGLFKIEEPVALAAFMHFGTLISIIIYFRKEILSIVRGIFKGERLSANYIVNVIIGSIPIIIFAFLFRTVIENSFGDPRLIAVFLGLTGIVLVITVLFRRGNQPMTRLKALIIGVGQMLAVFPGISRSGITISSGLLMKVEPRSAFQFSFLLSLPAVLGANLLELLSLKQSIDAISVLAGMLFSVLSGLAALFILRRMVVRYFHLFGIYCLIISIILLLL